TSDTPGGTVTFTIDGNTQTTLSLMNGQATYTTTALSVGSHTIAASYDGSPGVQTSTSATVSQTVGKASTATAVSSSVAPSVFGQPVTFNAAVAAVAPGAGTPTGTVTYTIDGIAQTPVLLNSRQASGSTATLSVGSHFITAVYSGDGSFNGS